MLCTISGYIIHAQESDYNSISPSTKPVFQVNFVHPTSDKPQSKLFFMDKCWWAVLPDSTGPTLWQRTKNGWINYPDVAESLKGISGRADVWVNKNEVTAVGVGDSSLTVFRMIKKSNKPVKWQTQILGELYSQIPTPIETATIAGDGSGNWWVAATANSKVYVWFSDKTGKNWLSPIVLAEGIDADDICTITPLKESVGVIWSDQVRDMVSMRIHKDGDPSGIWGEPEIIDSGNKTADDHLNTVLTQDGTLWVTSKNSVDKAGEPQFVLRKRSIEGKWTNIPYLILESRMKRPSRPIVVATEDNSYLFVGHGDNDRSVPYPHNSEIEFATVSINSFSVEQLEITKPIIVPDSTFKFMVHNVTGPKNPFPKDAPWIILAGDAEGRVYEADLKKLIKR